MREDRILSELGKRINAIRTNLGLSQEKFAEISDLDRTYISSVERGQRNVSLLNIVKICDALNVTPSYLLDGLGGQGIKAGGLELAYQVYTRYIDDQEKIELIRSHGLKVAGSVPSVIWELFASAITGQTGNGITGADLYGWEVKSATLGSSFEYQYHLNTGAQKLEEDCHVNHLFFSYSDGYRNVAVWAMRGEELAEQYFRQWEPGYEVNYDSLAPSEKRKQRFRKTIKFAHVRDNGRLVLEIQNGNLIFSDQSIIDELNQAFK